MKPILKFDKDNIPNSFPQRILEKHFSVWETIIIQGSLPAKEFINFFENKYILHKVIIYFISYNCNKIIEPIFGKNTNTEEIEKKYNLLIEEKIIR